MISKLLFLGAVVAMSTVSAARLRDSAQAVFSTPKSPYVTSQGKSSSNINSRVSESKNETNDTNSDAALEGSARVEADQKFSPPASIPEHEWDMADFDDVDDFDFSKYADDSDDFDDSDYDEDTDDADDAFDADDFVLPPPFGDAGKVFDSLGKSLDDAGKAFDQAGKIFKEGKGKGPVVPPEVIAALNSIAGSQEDIKEFVEDLAAKFDKFTAQIRSDLEESEDQHKQDLENIISEIDNQRDEIAVKVHEGFESLDDDLDESNAELHAHIEFSADEISDDFDEQIDSLAESKETFLQKMLLRSA